MHEELLTCCCHFGVGLISFKVNELIIAINPIKLREYLAAGLLVASTPMSEVKLCKHLIEIVNLPAEFEVGVKRSLSTAEADRTARLRPIFSETWPHKMERISEALYWEK